MASIRRPHSPAKQQHLLRHHHPFASSSPPSSPLRHSSSSSSPRNHHPGHHPHPFLFFTRRPLPRFAAFFLLGSFLGLLHFLSHLPLRPHLPVPPNTASQFNHLQQQQQRQAAATNASSDSIDYRPHQMNAGLEMVENHRLDGVVYFADEEGVYSLQLFDRLRQIRRFGTWPVPVISDSGNGVVVEGPVCKQNQVVGWHTSGDGNKLQRFHVAMSGFAFNSTMLWDPKLRSHLAWNSIRHPEMVEEGSQGTMFVEQLVEDESQMEGLPAHCFEIMNWHVPFGSENLVYPKGWRVVTNLDVMIPLK